ncbi:MFS transporter [Saliphagus infecundisoli]|uniref:MFS transporter n=1 Tax=Saliphagus infecundisoli TaxID=1849069 RepID=A0ABD5QFD2_9EURY|nr:MFS transporter [Saliphagus infecundisoli]
MTATEETGMSAVPWDSSALYVILASSLVGVMGVSMVSPVLPDLRAAFGVSDAQVGLVITAYTLPGIVLTPFIGLVADRLGRRRVIVPLLFVFGTAGAGVAFVESFRAVLGLRFLQGIGASALVTLAVTMIGDFYEGTRRDAVMGLNGSTLGTGAAIYPLIGGTLGAIRWNVPFLFFGVAVVVGVVTLFVLEEPHQERSSDLRTYLRGLRDVLRTPEALAIFAAIFVVFTVFYGLVLTALPLLLADQFGLGAGAIGPVLAMVSVASATVSSQYGRVSEWRSAPELVALGFVAYGASLIGVRLAPSPILVGVALLAFGVGFGIVMPSIDTTVITLVSDRLRAGVMGLRTSVLRLGQTVGPTAVPFVAETFFPVPAEGYRALLVVCGSGMALLGAAGYLLLRR